MHTARHAPPTASKLPPSHAGAQGATPGPGAWGGSPPHTEPEPPSNSVPQRQAQATKDPPHAVPERGAA
ncbi:MAG: hypothetical protein AAGF95_31805 [Chloroflexota bacterium]